MANMSNRLQVLLDDDRFRRLQLRSRATGASIGALVREAIDVAYPGVETDRERAGKAILAAEPMPVDDWDVMKAEMLDSMWKG